jgi:hypothetical protein
LDDFPGLPIQHAICLGAGRPNGRTFARIQDAELNSCVVRGGRHYAAKRIYFLDQMPFSNPADGWIAGHLPKRFDVVGKQQRAATRPCGSQGGFRTGVSTADHDYIE